jgi:hypothetical protein
MSAPDPPMSAFEPPSPVRVSSWEEPWRSSTSEAIVSRAPLGPSTLLPSFAPPPKSAVTPAACPE